MEQKDKRCMSKQEGRRSLGCGRQLRPHVKQSAEWASGACLSVARRCRGHLQVTWRSHLG